mgnify:CR=1 FL=1
MHLELRVQVVQTKHELLRKTHYQQQLSRNGASTDPMHNVFEHILLERSVALHKALE